MDGELIGAGADIFSAIGTVGAFAVGMVLLRQEHRREEARSVEDQRNQAVMVSAWLELHRTPVGGSELRFHVHNASAMPIFEVSLANSVPDDEDQSEAEFIALVPPGQTVERPAPKSWATSYFSPEPVEIEFIDSSGRRWKRDERGSLSRDSD